MFNGYTRKVVFPLVAMVTLGWFLFIVGFGIETNPAPGFNTAGDSFRYSWWMVTLATPISIALAVAQAAIDKNRLAMNILGATTAFFSALLLTALGAILNSYGIILWNGYRAPSTDLQFSGAFIETFFWVGVMCVSQFYERDGDLVN